MIKVTDYIAKRLKEFGVKDVFMVTGGGAMHLNDSLGREFNYICNHHEQACAIAAEGYARVNGKLAVVNVTTGPGGLNTLNGVLGQWTDSVPVLYLSGQVKFETTIHACPEIPLRQLGDQEVDIIPVVRSLTKYSIMLTKAEDVRYELEKAIFIATSGRPGPVWIDVPMNIQSALIDESKLRAFVPEKTNENSIDKEIDIVVKKILSAKRPVIIAGHGIRIAGAIDNFYKLLSDCNIPVVTTFNGMDILTDEDPHFIGRFGTLGTRAGNFAVQNADVLITIGTRNNIRQVSYNWETFAREAYKIIVDIDPAELNKPTLIPDLPICADANEFILQLHKKLGDVSAMHGEWLSWCQERKNKYPTVLSDYYKLKEDVHPYVFMQLLSEQMHENDVCVAGNGSACVVAFQAMKVKKNQRIFWNSGCASMGYELPAAIGACIANDRKKVICLAGDGSLQMNIQELQTIIQHKLPIKLFYLNNGGYISIVQTQDAFFKGHRVGADEKSGVSFPDIIKLGNAYGFKTYQIRNHEKMDETINEILNTSGPIICEVVLTQNYKFSPKLSSRKLEDGRMVSSPLEDLSPFLDRKEFKGNLFVKEWNP